MTDFSRSRCPACGFAAFKRLALLSAVRRCFAVAVVGSLAGCAVNGVKAIGGAVPDIRDDHAVVVVGVTIKGSWAHPRFGVTLDQYDTKAQSITGDCFFYNRLEVVVPATAAPTRFLAFDVPAGHYIYSAFNGATFAERDHAFQARPGHAVYVGNFELGSNGIVMLRSDFAENQSAIARALPNVPAGLEAAPVTSAAPARPFMCTP